MLRLCIWLDDQGRYGIVRSEEISTMNSIMSYDFSDSFPIPQRNKAISGIVVDPVVINPCC